MALRTLAGPGLALGLASGLAIAVPTAASGSADVGGPGPTTSVAIVGVPGLGWADVTAAGTPALWRLAGAGTVGSLSVRATAALNCRQDGWLTLGAGNRSAGEAHRDSSCPAGQPSPLPEPTGDGGAVVAAVPGLRRANAALAFGADIGALGSAVRRAGLCTSAIGVGAALGLADAAGRVDRYAADLPPDPAPALQRCSLTGVELPQLLGAAAVGPARDAALSALDGQLATIEAHRAPGSTLLLAGLSEGGAADAPADAVPRLHVAVALGPSGGAQGYEGGWLSAASTRRPPFVQLIDVAPTALGLLGLPQPPSAVGQRWDRAGGRPRAIASSVERLRDLDRAASAHRRLVPPFFSILVLSQLGLYLVCALTLRSGSRTRRRLVTSRLAALAFAAVPVSTYLANLIPWWRAGPQLAVLLGAVAVADLAVVLLAHAGPWRRGLLGPAGAVATITAGVLAVDLLSGAHLQLVSLAGYSPLVAGRFAGIGNLAYGVFAAAVLLSAAAAAACARAAGWSRRAVISVVAGIGVAAVVIDGSPQWGSDLGGVLALVPGVVLLVLLIGRLRVTLGRLVLAGATGVVAVAGFALADYARPAAERTHLGRFVDQLLRGQAATVIGRKAGANLHLLTHSVLTLLVPLAAIFFAIVLLRSSTAGQGGLRRAFTRAPELRAGLVAVLVTAVLAALTNDSGVVITALAMTVAVPAAIAVSLRALEPDGDTPRPAAVSPAGSGGTPDRLPLSPVDRYGHGSAGAS